jgi:hypothetical protein
MSTNPLIVKSDVGQVTVHVVEVVLDVRAIS